MRPYVNCVSLSLLPGYIYVDLHSDAEVDKALQKTNDYMGGFYKHTVVQHRLIKVCYNVFVYVRLTEDL